MFIAYLFSDYLEATVVELKYEYQFVRVWEEEG